MVLWWTFSSISCYKGVRMPRPPSTERRVRLNLEVTERVRERLHKIKALIEADSITEVIRRALFVYEFVLKTRGRLVIRSKDGTERDVILLG